MVVRNRFINGQILSSVGKKAIAEKHCTREFRFIVFPCFCRVNIKDDDILGDRSIKWKIKNDVKQMRSIEITDEFFF